MGKRVLLFVGTNLAIMALLGIVLGIAAGPLGLNTSGYVGLLIISLVVGMGGAFISLAMSKKIATWSTGAQVIEQPRNDAERWVLETTHRLADQAGIGRPDVAIWDSPDLNAFATGARRDNSLVAVSTGLLRSMRQEEVEAVLAHEIAHIANGDMVTLTLIQGVLNTVVVFLSRILGRIVDRAVFNNRDGGFGIGYFMVTILFQVVLGFFASMIVMWFSRRREFRADSGGASLTSNAAMAAALERLQLASAAPPQAELPEQMAAMGIRAGKPTGIKALLMSHPPLEDRIAALRAA